MSYGNASIVLILILNTDFSVCISLAPKIKIFLRKIFLKILAWKRPDYNYRVIFKGCFSFKRDESAEMTDNSFN